MRGTAKAAEEGGALLSLTMVRQNVRRSGELRVAWVCPICPWAAGAGPH
jgi:hypothetical protein